jgi:ABC-type phosphate transport system substrate-binding protein
LRCPVSVFVILLLVATGAAESPASAENPGFLVIVNADVEGTAIARATLSSIFLGDAPRWGDGRPIRPVDQSLQSEVRATFTEDVHNRPLEGIKALWHRKLMAGVRPPKVKSTDEEVIAFVAKTGGAIGYVATDTTLPETVRVVTIVD